jgi:hypothetical protein
MSSLPFSVCVASVGGDPRTRAMVVKNYLTYRCGLYVG